MEPKKTEKADLKNKTALFFNIGLFVTMAIVVTAFEWPDKGDGELVELGQISDDFEDLLEIPPTEQPPPPPPKIKQPEIIEIPDEEEIEEEIEVDLDVEITEEEVIEDIVMEEAPAEEVADEIFTIVEDMPSFPGGEAAMYKYLSENIKYPSQAKRMDIQGKVYIQFIIDRDGTVTAVNAVKGIGGGCDEEAARVVKAMPKWAPAKQRGKPVKLRMILPITFKLN